MGNIKLVDDQRSAKDEGSREYNLRAILVIIYAFKLFNESKKLKATMSYYSNIVTSMYLTHKRSSIYTQVRYLARYVFHKRDVGSKLLKNTYDKHFDKKAEDIRILIEKM